MAGLGKKTFTAGEVLTASDTNGYLMEQTVMNFAGTAARASAIPTPSEGMISYRQDIDNLELYNGTSWTSASGLQLVKKQTVGTGVSTVTVTSCFSATYDNYRILYVGGVASGSGSSLFARGAQGTGTNVVFAGQYIDVTGARTGLGSTATTYMTVGLTGSSQMTVTIDISNPFLSAQTGYVSNSFGWGIGVGYLTNTGGTDVQTLSSTGFIIAPATGTITGGTIYVYGYGV